ncbi:hypothetical protein LBMAG53_30990 [Planctomycetota bacterium]|nr:hypothetical protein LBMAG53_30990 [Planctomycetota bacterium]
MASADPPLTRVAASRLRQPLRRGAFRTVDAARRGLGLLSVADGDGQAGIDWLIDLGDQRVADARFLAFGNLWSHPAADVFCELAKDRSVAEACALPSAAIELRLRDEPESPTGADLSFIADLQQRALAALPSVTVLPKPVEKPVYQRKREADWTTADRAWLPLSYLRKVAKVDALLGQVVAAKLPAGATAQVESLNDDLRIGVRLTGLETDQHATVQQLLSDALKPIHPELAVEVLP